MKIRNILLILLILPLLGFSQYVKRSGPIVQILPGQIGVKSIPSDGLQKDIIYKEGNYFINPFHTMHVYDVKRQLFSERMEIIDGMGLQLTVNYNVYYAPLVDEIVYLHSEYGPTYLEEVVKPGVRSAFIEVIGEYTYGSTNQLINEKDKIAIKIHEKAAISLKEKHISLDEIRIMGITLPQSVIDAIERYRIAELKVIKEQLKKLRSELLIYKNELKDCKQNNCLDSTTKEIEQKIENQLESISSMEKLLYDLNE